MVVLSPVNFTLCSTLGVLVKPGDRISDQKKKGRGCRKRNLRIKNILESLDRPQFFLASLVPGSHLGMRQGQGGEAQGWGQGSRLPWQARFMIWLSRGETEPAAIQAVKSGPVFLGGASVPKAGASIWPLCVVHLSPWSSGPGWPPFCLLKLLRPAPSFSSPWYAAALSGTVNGHGSAAYLGTLHDTHPSLCLPGL